MTSPSGPYYYEKGGKTYHWESSCSKNKYPNLNWLMTWARPVNKEECSECRSKAFIHN